ncbi:MAG: sulfotransferase [Chloroflexi bacterium]|nr:sulfotransferase [Chloroflexota bacterium]
MTLPNFLILGTQKAATTWMHRCMREHPDIFMPRKKEIPFFEEPYYSEHNQDIKWYEQWFAEYAGQKAIGEARPSYLYRKESPGLIYKHLPNARLIVSLRDPVDRAISAYFWIMRMGYIPIRDPNEWFRESNWGDWRSVNYVSERVRKAVRNSQRVTSEESGQLAEASYESILEMGFYYEQLMRYLDLFPREKILVLIYEDICINPVHWLQTIFRFLEVDDSFIPPSINAKELTGEYSLVGTHLLHRAWHYGLTKPVNYLVRILGHLGLKKEMPISEDVIAKLANLYRQQNTKLAEFLHRDLNMWK